MIYLDNAASTAIHQDVLDEMIPYLKELYGNPSSIHRYGRLTEKAIKIMPVLSIAVDAAE